MADERVDGLTDPEGEVMDHLVAAVNAYAGLPQEHPSDLSEFVDGLHRCQHVLALRVVRRAHPEGWHTEGADDG